MVLTGLGIRKCMSSGLASCMFTIRCVSILFCCSSRMYYHWIAWGSAPVSQPEYDMLHISRTFICMLDCWCLDWEVAS